MSEKHPCCASHCCVKHGCKYGHDDCPVVLGEEEQEHPCEDCDVDRMEAGAKAGQIVMDRVELLRVLNDNKHLGGQVKELQMALTLKEEQLRAHRRVKLDEAARAALEADLAETTERVRRGYEEFEAKKGS